MTVERDFLEVTTTGDVLGKLLARSENSAILPRPKKSRKLDWVFYWYV